MTRAPSPSLAPFALAPGCEVEGSCGVLSLRTLESLGSIPNTTTSPLGVAAFEPEFAAWGERESLAMTTDAMAGIRVPRGTATSVVPFAPPADVEEQKKRRRLTVTVVQDTLPSCTFALGKM